MTNAANIKNCEKKLLHYAGKAIADYQMIKTGDRVLAGLSGGKDSFTMVKILNTLQIKSNRKFKLHVIVVDKKLPGWQSADITTWLKNHNIPFTVLETNIFNLVQAKKRRNSSLCILCSRLRRGHIYTFARNNNFNKIALGHHREDAITSLLMSIFYNGNISSMPPKLLTNDKKLLVIRPLIYCQEKDISLYAKMQNFPLSPKGLCGAEENSMRKQTQDLIAELAKANQKIPSNILHALQKICPSQLMDQKMWDFRNLEKQCLIHDD